MCRFRINVRTRCLLFGWFNHPAWSIFDAKDMDINKFTENEEENE